ncbi:hypothetical protein BOTBODRAFT_170588 [Botryobasidium botryosum FD-172 SS1]|uniref:Uncharacterized protein n=1 Tax=Botryobasidium botryosum (strain FD-172 SS1) TaxID=930990 RepID=A0A067N6U2_BOTB1|nr:hypothetical protein BOTBODRAFT_170588 [Botryobasidium botryosum FD-172 SS1]
MGSARDQTALAPCFRTQRRPWRRFLFHGELAHPVLPLQAGLVHGCILHAHRAHRPPASTPISITLLGLSKSLSQGSTLPMLPSPVGPDVPSLLQSGARSPHVPWVKPSKLHDHTLFVPLPIYHRTASYPLLTPYDLLRALKLRLKPSPANPTTFRLPMSSSTDSSILVNASTFRILSLSGQPVQEPRACTLHPSNRPLGYLHYKRHTVHPSLFPFFFPVSPHVARTCPSTKAGRVPPYCCPC